VQGCLTNTLGEYEKGVPIFECFNVGLIKKGAEGEGSEYGNSGVRASGGGVGWTMSVVLGLSIIGASIGAL
jgi:hypothetical protein